MREQLLHEVINVVVVPVEAAGAAVVVFGVGRAVVRFVVEGVRHRDAARFTRIRLSLGRFLALGLEFQLAADILRTTVTPSFAEIGQLAAVAAIRTMLNIFLRREIEQEQRQVASPAAGTTRAGAPGNTIDR